MQKAPPILGCEDCCGFPGWRKMSSFKMDAPWKVWSYLVWNCLPNGVFVMLPFSCLLICGLLWNFFVHDRVICEYCFISSCLIFVPFPLSRPSLPQGRALFHLTWADAFLGRAWGLAPGALPFLSASRTLLSGNASSPECFRLLFSISFPISSDLSWPGLSNRLAVPWTPTIASPSSSVGYSGFSVVQTRKKQS